MGVFLHLNWKIGTAEESGGSEINLACRMDVITITAVQFLDFT